MWRPQFDPISSFFESRKGKKKEPDDNRNRWARVRLTDDLRLHFPINEQKIVAHIRTICGVCRCAFNTHIFRCVLHPPSILFLLSLVRIMNSGRLQHACCWLSHCFGCATTRGRKKRGGFKDIKWHAKKDRRWCQPYSFFPSLSSPSLGVNYQPGLLVSL